MTLPTILSDLHRTTTPREWAGDALGAVALFATLWGACWALPVLFG